jgi:hypothetical protein
MNDYYVAFYDGERKKVNQVTKIKKDMDFISFKQYCSEKLVNGEQYYIIDPYSGNQDVVAFLFKFKNLVNLKDVVDKLDDLQNEIYDMSKDINEYIDELKK